MPCCSDPKRNSGKLGRERERERDLPSNYPFLFVETLQPLEADWKGRPQRVFCFSASLQFSLFGLPQGKTPGDVCFVFATF